MKRFLEWFHLKKFIDAKNHQPPLVSRGDLWWISIGENVGHEIGGKDADFARTAVVHTKLSDKTFLVIPTTTQMKNGTWYADFKQGGKPMSACLQQVRVIDYRRLLWKVGTLDQEDFNRIKKGFNTLYG